MFKPLQAVQVLFMTKILIPGKLFLAGEYAITHPGNTALIATTKNQPPKHRSYIPIQLLPIGISTLQKPQ